jgi:hypothetical protein
VYDGGDALKTARSEGGDIAPQVAVCPKLPLPPAPQREVPADVKYGGGSSKDGTLTWDWTVLTDGSRHFTASIWDGAQRRVVVDDRITAE